MYAVIHAKGHQFRVQTGDIIRVPSLSEANVGDKVVFNDVLFVGQKENSDIQVGRPYIQNAKVEAEVMAQIREKKVVSFKKKRRKGFHKIRGHRTQHTQLKVLSIQA